MSRRVPLRLLSLVLALGACAAPARDEAPRPVHLIVLHTNDVHGQALPRRGTGGLARLAAKVEEVRAEVDEPHEALLVVDAGDWFQGTPEGRIDGGAAFMRALLAIG